METWLNYFPFHLGDYASHTAHLEPLEDLAYRRMLDLYYMREGPLPDDIQAIGRLIRLRDNLGEIRAVLNEFFVQCDEGYRHTRCDAEISKMQDKQAKARASAKASVNARSANVQRTLNERSADVEPPTPTPTPKNTRAVAQPPDGVSDSVWDSFKALRKAKRAPITPAAMQGIQSEASRAGWSLEDALKECCARGWQGFKADWVAPQVQKQNMATVTVPGSKEPDPTLAKLDRDAQIPKGIPAELKDTIAKLTGKARA